MSNLLEARRSELLAKGRQGAKEKSDNKSRFEKRVKSRLSSSTKEYNSIDMNKLFKEDRLQIGIPINGETSSYIVTIRYDGFLKVLRNRLKDQDDIVDLRAILRALMDAFNSDDVYIHCTCADFLYRFNYWATRNNISSGTPELRPSNITNPKNNLGPGCKHIMLVLSNTSWIIKLASVINNYIKYIKRIRKKDYADIIYPAIFGKEYEEPVQIDIYSIDSNKRDALDTDKETIDTANEQGRVSGRFKAKNDRGPIKPDMPNKNQMSMDDIDNNNE